MTAWLVIVAVAIGTYALRVSMFLVLDSRDLPAWTERPMALIGPSAVAALVASLVLTSDGRAALPGAPTAAAIVVGFLAARRSGNVVHAFAAGLPAFWLLTAIGSMIG